MIETTFMIHKNIQECKLRCEKDETTFLELMLSQMQIKSMIMDKNEA